jgi:hypothetical protein
MKLKHNKLRNPAILFELLVRQISSDTFKNKDSASVDIIKKHYKNTQIAKEYKIYQTLAEAKEMSEAKANVLLNIAIEAHRKLNKSALKKQKYDLISSIKENYDLDEFFKTKIENYKTLASIYLLFEISSSDIIEPQKEAQYRYTILENMCLKPHVEQKDEVIEEYKTLDKGTKVLVYKLLVQKFNEKYSDLDINQKNLLKEYINNNSSSDKLREYINLEMVRVKADLKKKTSKLKDEVRKIKMNEVMNFIQEIPENKPVCDKDVENLLYYYELQKEFNAFEKI